MSRDSGCQLRSMRQRKLLTWSADCWTFSLRSLKDSKWKTPARYALSAPSVMLEGDASQLTRFFSIPLGLELAHLPSTSSLHPHALKCSSPLQTRGPFPFGTADNHKSPILPLPFLIPISSQFLHKSIKPPLALLGDIVEYIFRLVLSKSY
jgi:hypothetical protein